MVFKCTSCLTKRRAIGCRPDCLRARDWDSIKYRSYISVRDRPKRDSRTDDLIAAMGYYLGNLNSILHPIWLIFCGRRAGEPAPRHRSVSHSMGASGHPRRHPVSWSFLLSLLATLAGRTRSLGGSDSSVGGSSWQWECESSQGVGRISRD